MGVLSSTMVIKIGAHIALLSSPELKVSVCFITCRPASVRPSVNFSRFRQVCSNEGPCFFFKGYNYEKAKILVH